MIRSLFLFVAAFLVAALPIAADEPTAAAPTTESPAPAAPPADSPAPAAAAPPASSAAPALPEIFAKPPQRTKMVIPPMSPDKISNYYVYLKQVLAEEAAKPPRVPKKPNETLTKVQTYPFDAIEGLTSKELVRAAKEGMRDARNRMEGKPEKEIDLQVEENIRFALEYYPLIAVDADAFKNLFYIMEDSSADPVFRRLLFTNAVPGRGNDSLFSRFFQEGLHLDPDPVLQVYNRTIKDESEIPLIRKLALENIFEMYVMEFSDYLAKDASAADFKAVHGRGPRPRDMKDPNVFKPSMRLNSGIQDMREKTINYAIAISELIKPTSDAPQYVRDAVIALLNHMKDEIPLEDPSVIDNLIKEAAPARTEPPKAKSDSELAF